MSQTLNSNKMNRRHLLGSGAALMGAAASGLAFNPAASAQNTKATEPSPARSGTNTPNYVPPIVRVEGGQLRGFRDGKTLVFLGIPYAEAGRFELPKPVQPWQGVKNVQSWGPVCPAPPQTEVSGDEFVFPHRYWVANERCQVLNVWTVNASTSAKKPVMLWMHGGGFTNGASMESYAYDGKNLTEFGDVVVVSVNHRLNILGTLDLSAYGPEYI
jgi:para-nitrobenzyl esterase